MKKEYFLIGGIVIAGCLYLIINKWKRDWYKINADFGKKLGYPDCCVKEFCNQPPQLLKLIGVTDTDRLRYQAACIDGQFSGFIPCGEHAKKIIAGETELKDLIKNRGILFEEFPDF